MKLNILLLLTITLFFYACEKDSYSKDLINKAQDLAEENPEEAFSILGSIENPEELEKNNYMKYLVTLIQTKYKTDQDIKHDTLVFKARKYFEENKDYKYAALASYYSGCLYNERGDLEQNLETFKLAGNYSTKANDFLFAGKSFHGIGTIYYDKLMMDSATVYYKEALNQFNKLSDSDLLIMRTMRLVGLSYEAVNEFDSAYVYFSKGLELAEQLNNYDYKITFIHMLGLVYMGMEDYEKSSTYLYKAHSCTNNKDEYFRVALTSLQLYNRSNQVDSAKYYAKILVNLLDEINYVYTRQESFQALAEHFENIGDLKYAIHFNKLLNEANKEISVLNNSKKLAEAEYKYFVSLHQKEMEDMKRRNKLYCAFAIMIVSFVSVIFFIKYRANRRKRIEQEEKNRLLTIQLEMKNKLLQQQSKYLSYMNIIYQNIANKWTGIDKEVKALRKELGATAEPEVYIRMKDMIEGVKEETYAQFIDLAKEVIQDKPYGQEVLAKLKDRELLIFMLYYLGYNRNQVAVLLNVNSHKNNMMMRKLSIQNKLLNAGMPLHDIEKILFAEDNSM